MAKSQKIWDHAFVIKYKVEIVYFEDFASCINYVGMAYNWICLSSVVGDEPNHQINLNGYLPLLVLNQGDYQPVLGKGLRSFYCEIKYIIYNFPFLGVKE